MYLMDEVLNRNKFSIEIVDIYYKSIHRIWVELVLLLQRFFSVRTVLLICLLGGILSPA